MKIGKKVGETLGVAGHGIRGWMPDGPRMEQWLTSCCVIGRPDLPSLFYLALPGCWPQPSDRRRVLLRDMMLSDLQISVRDWFAWAPGLETRRAWRDWAQQNTAMAQTVATATASEISDAGDGLAALPMMLRRRIDSFSQKVLGAALACGDLQGARYVFVSRHGEFSRTLRILADLADQQPPSPADFSMSVHNALAGLLSIHTGNKAGHVTISAGTDTFSVGLVEVIASLAERPQQPVLLVCYDEPLPGEYRSFGQTEEPILPMILVLKLDCISYEQRPIQFSVSPVSHDGPSEKPSAVGLARDFLTFFLSDRETGTSIGERLTWRWHRAA